MSCNESTSTKFPFIVFVSLFLVSLCCLAVLASQDPDSRPRRSTQTVAPTPTPSPAPIKGTSPVSTSGSTQTPSSGPTPKAATPTPSPTPKPAPPDRIAPTLGEPPPPPKLKPTPTPEPPQEIEPDSVVKVNTELVTLNVRVIDRNNRPIDNVKESEFRVFEDGEPQPIEFFAKEEIPINYGMAVDTSGSLRSQIQSVIDAARIIVGSNKPGDETFVERFISSDNIQILQDFTADKNLTLDALENLYIEGGQTAVIDGVYLAADYVAKYKKGDDSDRRRRALIVITDGEDRNSFYKEEQLFARLREEDVQIYVIGFVNELGKEAGFIRKSPREKALNLLNRLAAETGGRAFYPQSLSELPQIANEIIRDLRTQYVIAYNPTNKARDGSYRAIKVSVTESGSSEKRIALTRSGRLAPKGGPPLKPLPQKAPAKSAQPGTKTRAGDSPN